MAENVLGDVILEVVSISILSFVTTCACARDCIIEHVDNSLQMIINYIFQMLYQCGTTKELSKSLT